MIVSTVICFLFTQPWIISGVWNLGTGQRLKDTLCPNLPSAYENRIHVATKKCYQTGLQGPCRAESKMVFVKEQDNDVYGECACDPEANRKMVYHNQTDQCYFIFEQGFCPEGHWITLYNEMPMCELNPCRDQNNINSPYDYPYEWVLLNGRCVRVERSDEDVCTPPQFITFEKGNLNPTCGCPTQCADGPCPAPTADEIQIDATAEMFKKRLCPELNNTERYRIDRKTEKCFDVSPYRQGPCGTNMIFTSESGNVIYGTCDCNPVESRTLIYDANSDQCYFIFQQAYCPNNQWLTFNRVTGQPICELNPCRNKNEGRGKGKTFDNAEFVVLNGQCVALNEQSNHCGENQIVGFVSGKILPTCTYSVGCGSVGSIAPVKEAPCTVGSHRSLSGRCTASWVW